MTRLLAAFILLVALGCGGGGSPTAPQPTPTPTPPETGETVVVVVFYDENDNGSLDPRELVRLPDVEVTAGGRSARTEKGTGRAVIRGVPAGTQTVAIKPGTLPPFYAAGSPAAVTLPLGQGSEIQLPATLDIGDNVPNVYMAFGDSITRGDGAATGGSYPAQLQSLLAAYLGDAQVNNRGADATNSYEAIERLDRNLRGSHPAFTLILYGTNDWHVIGCQDDAPACNTVDNLRTVIQGVKAFHSLPFLATLPPANPALAPASRNQWVKDINELLKPMAREEGAVVADVHAAFLKQQDLPSLFSDDVHLNQAGYAVIAQAFLDAIVHGESPPAARLDAYSLLTPP